MKTILLVKTSSLGDVVHNFPAVSDIRRERPDAVIDWVVEEAYAAIPRLHPGVASVISVAMRRWRGSPAGRGTWREISDFLTSLRGVRYDAVIDTQGLLKSAVIARAARGPRYGLDWRSSREPLRAFYDRTFNIPWSLHAVERNRTLVARALGYDLASPPEYGIRARAESFPWLALQHYVILAHATSAREKLWPEASWIELGAHCLRSRLGCVLPWGSEAERARSARLAAQVPGAVVPPALGLQELTGLIAGAQAVAGVDTGITHLAAALGAPTVGLYCATDPSATGLYACPRAVNLGGIGIPPAADEVIAALHRLVNGE